MDPYVKYICICDSRPTYRASIGIGRNSEARHLINPGDNMVSQVTDRQTKIPEAVQNIIGSHKELFTGIGKFNNLISEFSDRQSGDPNYPKRTTGSSIVPPTTFSSLRGT